MPLFRPAKPKAKAGLLADVVLAAGQQVIPLDELIWGEGDHGFSAGPGFTVGRSGLYLVTGSVSRAATATTSAIQIRWLLNGNTLPRMTIVNTPSTTALITAQCIEQIPCLAGDTLELAATLHGGAAATARRTGTFGSVIRIGPERWT